MHEIIRYLNGKTFLCRLGREIFGEEMGEDEDGNGIPRSDWVVCGLVT